MKNKIVLKTEDIQQKVLIIRGKKVMLDRDLAMLYEVPTKRLNEAVRRNKERFPDDFMFRLTKKESTVFLRSQIATLKKGRGKHVKHAPLVFTEQGIAMLSSVLNSPRAISVNIQIVRIFTKLREMVDAYKELREKIEIMEKNTELTFQEVFKILRLIVKKDEKPKARIGFET